MTIHEKMKTCKHHQQSNDQSKIITESEFYFRYENRMKKIFFFGTNNGLNVPIFLVLFCVLLFT